ncbi:hypothetical protein BDA96_03G359100 [Sorghum bicolor]|uniref:FMR1-interacting protein 1 conserved domain-containing protein n=1 Tax=Sorghum bicolor TaxID=4558 RepID=A0A921RGV8_SORBI|nr:hypothetical protein BDA96_03G359100 [Sorghum bicolor]
MRPFHPPRPNPNQHHRPRPGGDPGPPHLPGTPMHPAFPPPVPNLAAAAANPMAAAAAANPFLALQLLGQAQQLQNLGFLAAAALQQQQQQQAPFFPGGFPANPNQFAPFAGGPRPAGFNGGGAFRPGGPGFCGPRPPSSPAGNGSNNNNNAGSGGASRPILNVWRKDHNSKAGSGGTPGPILDVGRKDQNCSADGNGEVYHFENKADGISNFASESGNKITDQKSGFSAGRDGRGGRQFGAFRGRGRGRHPNQSRGRGSTNWGETKSNFMGRKSSASGHCSDIPAPASGGRRKPPRIIYDANEVKRWVEARKKNYPTSVNVHKKLSEINSDNENKDKDAQLRRQELKEVLAKQQELGFDLPELPPGYLSETGDQCIENKNNRKAQCRDSHFGNRSNNNKRPRYERGGFQSKRSKVWNRTPCADDAMAKSREPTLLQKLLSSDIKRDRHRLLHVFKFMTLNNFFKDWPDKPLQFPSVKVNQIEIGSTIGTDDLDNAEMANDSILGVNENGDCKELSSIDEEDTDSANHNDEDVDGVSADSSIEDGAEEEDAYEEQFNEPEDDTAV